LLPPWKSFYLRSSSSSVGLRFLDGQKAICYRVKELR
jgi:hypothetical protein